MITSYEQSTVASQFILTIKQYLEKNGSVISNFPISYYITRTIQFVRHNRK